MRDDRDERESANERRLRTLIENSWDVVAEIDTDGSLRSISSACRRVFGYSAEELAARGQFELVHPDDAPRVASTFAGFLERPGEVRRFQYRYLHKDGSWRWVEAIATNLVSDPNVSAIVVHYRDVTDVKLAEERLRASEQRFRKVIEKSWDALALLDASGSVLYVSPSATRIVGYEIDEFLGRSIFEYIHPDDLERTIHELSSILESPGATTTSLFRYRHGDGTWHWIEGAGTNLLADPDVAALVANFRDVTEARAAAEERDRLLEREQASRIEAERSNRAKDEFLAVLSHELRNPLSAVRNSILAARTSESVREQALDIALRQADQLTRLVDDLLDAARITRGQISLRKESVALPVVVERALEATRPLIEDLGLAVEVRLGSEPALVFGDPARLEQVALNLVENAAKYGAPGGRIEVEVARTAAETVLRVRDHGIGIAPEALPSLFQMFAQADRGSNRARGGLGIGLMLVKRIVELHDGRIEARSEGLGRGAEFVVHFPALFVAAEPPRSAPSPSRAVPPVRLMVVDDNADGAESLRMLLALEGHDVRVFHDGAAALDAAETAPPEVMIVDIGLPGIDGYEVARRARRHERLRSVSLIALTGYGRDEDKREARLAGFDRHLVKPVEPTALRDVLRDLRPPAG